MITKIIKQMSSLLPLSIKNIEWNDPSLILIGDDWTFATVTSWRIIDSEKFICGCYDEESTTEIQKLKGTKVISISIQSNRLPVDPVFEFSNRWKLEIFSATYLEPWIFDLPSKVVYVASPSDPKFVE